MTPYVYICAGVLWIASVIGVGYWQREDGKTVERSAWQARENSELAMANAKIVELEETARATERKHANQIASISRNLQEEIARAKLQKDLDSVAARNGALRLYDKFAAGVCADRDKAGAVGAGAGRRDGSTGCELSSEAAQFLLGLAGDADDIARQLTACQAVITSDRSL